MITPYRLVLLFLVTVPFSVLAQTSEVSDVQSPEGETRSVIETETSETLVEKNHQVTLDFVPTLLASGAKGLGVSYHYGLFSNLSVGAFADYFETDKFSNGSSYREIDWTSASTGLESKLFLSEFGKGLYLGAAATYVYIKGKGRVRSFSGNTWAEVEDDADAFGYLAKLGYAFTGNTMKDGSIFIMDFALSYGTGNAFRYSTVSSGGTGSMRIREIEDGLSFYGGLGILF